MQELSEAPTTPSDEDLSLGTPRGTALPDAVVLRAIDAARGHVESVIQEVAIPGRKPAVVPRAHHAHLAMDATVLPLEACSLMEIERALAEAVGDASLLVELTLSKRGLWCNRRGGLSDCYGRRRKQSRHQD